MGKKTNTRTATAVEPSPLRLTKARLERLIEDATIDCYNEAEQATGLYTMIEDNLQLPFETEMLGVQVTVTRVDISEGDQIVAVCKRGRLKQKVPVLELPLPTPRPTGSEWIEAYRHWARSK